MKKTYLKGEILTISTPPTENNICSNLTQVCQSVRQTPVQFILFSLPVPPYPHPRLAEMLAKVVLDSLTATPLSIANSLGSRANTATDCQIHRAHAAHCNFPALVATSLIYCPASLRRPNWHNYQFQLVKVLGHYDQYSNY